MKMISKQSFIYIAAKELFNETIKSKEYNETYLTQQWQRINQKNYVQFDKNGNLPENIRKTKNGKYEINLAKTEFFDLPVDIQYDYLYNIELACDIMKSHNFEIVDKKEVVDFFRFELFKVSPWASNDPILNMDYEKLPKYEKDDFYKPYDVALKTLDKLKENNYLVEDINSNEDFTI